MSKTPHLKQVAPVSARLVAIATIDLVIGVLALLSMLFMPATVELFGMEVLAWAALSIAVLAVTIGALGILAGYGVLTDLILGTAGSLFKLRVTKHLAYLKSFLCMIAFLYAVALSLSLANLIFYFVLAAFDAGMGYMASSLVKMMSAPYGAMSYKLDL